MKKNTLLYILLIVLLISNAFFLFKHFGGKHDGRGDNRKGSRDYIVKELNFTEAQQMQYDNLRSTFFNIMKMKDSSLRLLKNDFYNNLTHDELSAKEIDSIASLISEQEKQKDIELFNYLSNVRSMCDDEQKIRFGEIVKRRVTNRNGKGRGKRR